MNDRVRKCLERDKEFAEALMNVKGSYDDFVTSSFVGLGKYPDYREKMLAFIREHDGVTSSDVCHYYSEEFRGFKRKPWSKFKYSFEE